ncbi:MAG: acylglycerol lipase [Thermoproteota archaeon]|jgi:acylglycerol lipase
MELSTGTIKLRDGIELFYQIKNYGHSDWVIHTHGVGEYAGRHEYLGDLLGKTKNVFQYDVRGHGRSGGKKAWVANFTDFIEDLSEVISFCNEELSIKDYVLMGHSMGAAIVCGYIQSHADFNVYPKKIVVTSPPANVGGPLEGLAIKMSMVWVNRLAGINMSAAVPGLVDISVLSHSPEVAEAYKADSHNCLRLHTKLAVGILKGVRDIFSKPLNPKCPAYITIGSQDKVVSYKTNLSYFCEIEKNFEMKVFEGAYHEIHNEIDTYRKPFFEYLQSVV